MIAQVSRRIFDPIVNADIMVWENFAALGEIQSAGTGEILKGPGITDKLFPIPGSLAQVALDPGIDTLADFPDGPAGSTSGDSRCLKIT